MPEPLADEVHEAPIRDSEAVYEGKVWDVRRDVFELDGHEIAREYLDHTGAVAVLAMDEDGRVLLIRQYRHPVRRRDWEIPAGLLDVAGEHPLDTARRELAEEADLAAEEWSVLAEFMSSPGSSNETIRVYLATGLHELEPFERSEEEAGIEKRWASLEEAVEGVLARRLGNPTLTVGVLAAQARGLGRPALGAAEEPWHAATGPRRR